MQSKKLFLFISTLIFSHICLAQHAPIKIDTKRDSVVYNNFKPVRLAEINYNKKAISQIGFGKTTQTSINNVTNSRDTNTIFSLSYATNRWWINKYFAGGWFYDMTINQKGGYVIGPQITGFAEFDEFILPYATFGTGFGYAYIGDKSKTQLKSQIYIPYFLKIGTYIFFKKNRGFALFAEFNKQLNVENRPIYRIGIAWSKLKR